ncbi:hypothetical protein F6R98_06155 [Candidatus Methylospira mobilis]|uniref:Uncharacterized protein n=1 Tax=Candidatus Methylospira mobilis TaxID=1808979 RepID=A0A5Q0BJ75_9GAMM|nr:hypothetical protein [Candidatus Methylospira mobilis]QFY42261.1 hypothetical protein F6R98_06155 [Candidatus Methylospira mobilis]WNV03285.1 hypothetical protein RP726_12525 [Candidatus Methylospira mobilis]
MNNFTHMVFLHNLDHLDSPLAYLLYSMHQSAYLANEQVIQFLPCSEIVVSGPYFSARVHRLYDGQEVEDEVFLPHNLIAAILPLDSHKRQLGFVPEESREQQKSASVVEIQIELTEEHTHP